VGPKTDCARKKPYFRRRGKKGRSSRGTEGENREEKEATSLYRERAIPVIRRAYGDDRRVGTVPGGKPAQISGQRGNGPYETK